MIFNIFEQIFLDAGVDVNLRNMHNTIPLHVALARGAKLCVGLLLSAGANCNIQVCYNLYYVDNFVDQTSVMPFEHGVNIHHLLKNTLERGECMLRIKMSAI